MSDIDIRILKENAELEAAVELQKVYWGQDMADLVPFHMLRSIANHGGHVHGAYDGEKMVGMLLGFLGANIQPEGTGDAPRNLLVMSKRMVVLPAYRGRKIGEQLKHAQADFARRHNIQLVTWTFDPMLSRNAYLNICKLRAIGQGYVENYFGAGADNPVLSSDRLVTNWWVSHPRQSTVSQIDTLSIPLANSVSLSQDGLLVPLQLDLKDEIEAVRLEIPVEFHPIERIEPEIASRWRDHVRSAFQHFLASGYIVTDFRRVENRVFYVFTRDDGTFTFQY